MSRDREGPSSDAEFTHFEHGRSAETAPHSRVSPSGDRYYFAGDAIADRYRLERKLGEGGMGVVWVARSLVLDIDVALKLIRASVAGASVASRMAREAHAAARVAHPALVRVFDFGWTDHADPFLVMELVQGESLDSVLEREVRVAATRAVQILLPLVDGLRCAHEKGVVHRDVKPENVLLATDPFGRLQPKLLDFGIAKTTEYRPSDGRLTRAGAVLGSPEFMSPEQARGQLDVDERTDVWSTCVMLYEMLTGVVPFQKDNYNALMQAILRDEPTPTHLLDAGDEGLWCVISRGLRKEPDDRWSSMTELGEALAFWLYERGVKEDVSGNSVRALWLDGTASGVQSAPFASPDTGSPDECAELPLVLPPESASSSLFGIRERWFGEWRNHRGRLLLMGAAILGAVVVGHWLVVRPPQSDIGDADHAASVGSLASAAAPLQSAATAAPSVAEPIGSVHARGDSPARPRSTSEAAEQEPARPAESHAPGADGSASGDPASPGLEVKSQGPTRPRRRAPRQLPVHDFGF